MGSMSDMGTWPYARYLLFDVLWQTRRKFILNKTNNTPSSMCPRLNENLYFTNLS